MAVPAGAPPDPFVLELDHSTEPILARLPRGRHGLPRDFVQRNHQYRLLGAVIDAVAERGYAATTVSDITRYAAVSRRAFYEHFSDKGDCFVRAYDIAVEWVFEAVEADLNSEEEWPRPLARAVERTVEILAADPRLARIFTVEVFLAGPVAVARHEALVERLAALLRGGREESLGSEPLPLQLEEALIGGAFSLVARYVHTGRVEHLSELAPVLNDLLLSPYLGHDGAPR